MRRALTTLGTLALTTVLAVPAAAQHDAHAGHGAAFPEGWQGRVDRASQNLADVRFMRMGEAFHVVTGPHVILWHPANAAEGSYRAEATFVQARAPERREGFGLIVGGQRLDEPGQDYLYLLIRHDGHFLIRHRAGDEVHTLAEWTAHEAIRQPGATSGAENTVAIEALAARVNFIVNGTTVYSLERIPMLNTDGIAGFRVGHHLDVHVRDFTIRPITQE